MHDESTRQGQPSAKRQGPPLRGPGAASFKRKKVTPKQRFDKQTPAQNVAHIKSEEPKASGIQMYAAKRTFVINIGNGGVNMLSRVIFNAIQSRDYRMAQNMTALQLKYVLTMAYANRVVQTAIHGGYALDIPGASDLKRAAGSIQLPGLLVKYVESIGIYKKATGGTVAPFAGDFPTLFPANSKQQCSPRSILAEADRPIPNNLWCIDWAWIQAWNEATTRPSRLGMTFASVESSTYEGRAEMLVSFKRVDDPFDDDGQPLTLQGCSPQTMSEAEGMLGACYGFRDYVDQTTWLPGNKSILFAEFLTTEFQPEQYLSDMVVASFTA